jgi:uncharacterized protein
VEIAGIIIFSFFSLIGIILIVLGLPGTFSILAGTFSYALLTDFRLIGWKLLLILLFMSAFAELVDNLLSMLGAKKSGASRGSTWAVLMGGIAGATFGGLLAPVIGSLIGAFIGGAVAPIIMEYLHCKRFYPALRAGMGALIGRLGGILLKFLISVGMIVIVLINIF